jgi:hypothetical protein
MSSSLYHASVPVFRQLLGGLSAIMGKAAAYAEARKIDPAVLVAARLYPDMFPFSRQVMIATDFAKGASSRLAGVEVPKYEDTETTFAELQARIAKTMDHLASLTPAQFDGAETRPVTIPLRGEPVTFQGRAYLFHYALPNFYFHVTTAYAILRHNGLEIGKPDFIHQLITE